MIGGGDENRVQVEYLDAEILEIIELVDDTLDIAAVEAAEIGVGGDVVPVRGMLDVADGIVIFVIHDVVGRIPVAEPVGEDLVLHGAFGPGGHMEPGNETEGISRVELGIVIIHNAGAALVIGHTDALGAFDQKAIDKGLAVADHGGFIIIKIIVRGDLCHEDAKGERLRHQNGAGNAALFHAEADFDRIPGIRLTRGAEAGRFITENGREEGRVQGHGAHSFLRLILS